MWSYSGDPSNSTKDKIRFMIGDVDEDEQLLQDSEINWVIEQHDSVWGAAAECCETIAAQFAKRVDVRTEDFNAGIGSKVDHYNALAKEFRRKDISAQKGYAGGISISDKESQKADSDRVSPRFKKGKFDNS